jgi:uncharacterized SAM-binding protein YcdF (DUF218 family)
MGPEGLLTLAASMAVGMATGGMTIVWAVISVVRGAVAVPVEYPSAPTIMIFGMRLEGDEPRGDYRRRLERGRTLADAHPSARLLLLGGFTGGGISEAEAGRRYLVDRGVEVGRIDVEERSTHSLENLREARAILADTREPVTVISNRYHLKRIVTLAEGLGMTVAPCAAEERWSLHPYTLWRLFLEGLFLHWYHTGRIVSYAVGSKHMIDRIT